ALKITTQKVPKEYRNKRIYTGGISQIPTSGLGSTGTGGSEYIAGNGIEIAAN
ncbi:unnamed protein product, partial [marine sediment metagenome]